MLKRPKEVQFEFPQPPAPYPPSHRSGASIGPSGVGCATTEASSQTLVLLGTQHFCVAGAILAWRVLVRVRGQP